MRRAQTQCPLQMAQTAADMQTSVLNAPALEYDRADCCMLDFSEILCDLISDCRILAAESRDLTCSYIMQLVSGC